MDRDLLRRRLLATVTTSLGLYACTEPAPPPQAAMLPGGDSGAPRATLTPTPTPTSDTALAPPARPSASSARTCQPGTKAERYCFAKNTLPPQPMRAPAPPPPMDANGCVAAAIVHDGCNGVDDVLSGPAAAGGQCCYQICRGIPAPCGRPLVMTANGAPRVARAVRTDAGPREAAMPSPLGHALRTALRDAWLADAQLEHASIASFVRFTLELLAVGAPPELVTDAQRAGLDESAHAKACFALAQHHDPEHASYEAGPLDLAGFTLRTSLAEAAAAAVEEACCGETLAALALARAAASCTDPRVQATLARLAEDEARHAELGYRFVAWALRTGDDDVRTAVRVGFERGLASDDDGPSLRVTVPPRDAEAFRGAGRLSDEELARVRREARAEVIAPASRLLLGLS